MTQTKAILFDLDGTLVDSAGGIHAALDEVLRKLTGAGCTLEEVRQWIGNGPLKLVERGLHSRGCDEDARYALALFRDAYHLTLNQAEVYSGVVAGLAKLQQAGLKLACVTNKSSHFTGKFMVELGLAEFFDRVLCGDEVERPKPDPQSLHLICEGFGIEPNQAIMVGDSANDLKPAQAIGMPAIAVSYGYHGNVSLAQFDPIAIVDHFDAVVDRCLKEAD